MKCTDFCVGELSALDVGVLAGLARQSHRVLEFGAGGSTTVWAQFCPPRASITCVETNMEWTNRTIEMLQRLEARADVAFLSFDAWREKFTAHHWFDLIFIDGASERIGVSEASWPMLMPGGKMVWHDTHGPPLGEMVFQFMGKHNLEVSDVHCESALTICTKCVERNIGDVRAFENRELWMSGHAPLPAEWPPRRG
jgi:Methyltransferase domain